MTILFTKAQALGNDFVLIEGTPLKEEKIRHIADRRLGVGCDQVIFFQSTSTVDTFNVQFFNADGTAASACGNGSRALVTLLAQRANLPSSIILRTGERNLQCHYQGGIASINMGHALIFDVDALLLPNQIGQWHGVDVGNPHLIAFVEDLSPINIAEIGPSLENHPRFVDRVNVSIAQIKNGNILLKTWERGAGDTGACGTAACATAALAATKGFISDAVMVSQKGGDLTIFPTDEGILMSGTAALVFTGQIDA